MFASGAKRGANVDFDQVAGEHRQAEYSSVCQLFAAVIPPTGSSMRLAVLHEWKNEQVDSVCVVMKNKALLCIHLISRYCIVFVDKLL